MKWLPKDIREDVTRHQKHLASIAHIIDHIKGGLQWDLSKSLAQKRSRALRQKPVLSIVNNEELKDIDEWEARNVELVNALKFEFDDEREYHRVVLNAIGQAKRSPSKPQRQPGNRREAAPGPPRPHEEQRPTRPTSEPRNGGKPFRDRSGKIVITARYNGFNHCGSPNNLKQDCKTFAKLLEENQGKPQPNYEPAYRKWHKQELAEGKKLLNTVETGGDSDSDSDSDTDVEACALLKTRTVFALSKATSKNAEVPEAPKVKLHNSFRELTAEDDIDQLVEHCNAVAPHVKVQKQSLELSQKQRRALDQHRKDGQTRHWELYHSPCTTTKAVVFAERRI